jgi:hypothetical protein
MARPRRKLTLIRQLNRGDTLRREKPARTILDIGYVLNFALRAFLLGGDAMRSSEQKLSCFLRRHFDQLNADRLAMCGALILITSTSGSFEAISFTRLQYSLIDILEPGCIFISPLLPHEWNLKRSSTASAM